MSVAVKVLLVALCASLSAACSDDRNDQPQELVWPSGTLPQASADGPLTMVLVGNVAGTNFTDTLPYLASQSDCSAAAFYAWFLADASGACWLDVETPATFPVPGVYTPVETTPLLFSFAQEVRYYGAGRDRPNRGTLRILQQDIAGQGLLELIAHFSQLMDLQSQALVSSDLWVSIAGRCP